MPCRDPRLVFPIRVQIDPIEEGNLRFDPAAASASKGRWAAVALRLTGFSEP